MSVLVLALLEAFMSSHLSPSLRPGMKGFDNAGTALLDQHRRDIAPHGLPRPLDEALALLHTLSMPSVVQVEVALGPELLYQCGCCWFRCYEAGDQLRFCFVACIM